MWLHCERIVLHCTAQQTSAPLLQTALAGKVMQSAVSTCRLFPLYCLNQVNSDIDFYMCNCWGLKVSSHRSLVKVKGQCRNVCATQVSTVCTASYEYCLMAILAGFHHDVITGELASSNGGFQCVWVW